jgi:hypothetical protein
MEKGAGSRGNRGTEQGAGKNDYLDFGYFTHPHTTVILLVTMYLLL